MLYDCIVHDNPRRRDSFVAPDGHGCIYHQAVAMREVPRAPPTSAQPSEWVVGQLLDLYRNAQRSHQ